MVESSYTGVVMESDYTCPTGSTQTQTVRLVHGAPGDSHLLSETVAAVLDQNQNAVAEVLSVYCGPFIWDVNGDGLVSAGDIGAVVSEFGETVPPAPPEVDFDGDGVVASSDIGQVVSHFGEQAP
jgi:hypothetical protein